MKVISASLFANKITDALRKLCLIIKLPELLPSFTSLFTNKTTVTPTNTLLY